MTVSLIFTDGRVYIIPAVRQFVCHYNEVYVTCQKQTLMFLTGIKEVVVR